MNEAVSQEQGDEPVHPGTRLRQVMNTDAVTPLIGVYDTFSASIAGRHFQGIFVSGFSFAASHYGMPDIGFITWTDMLAFVQRLRAVLPHHHIVVDIDDGYCDTEVACHMTRQLAKIGASAVILEDQQRPRKCGHLDGKQTMELDAFLDKLTKVLACRGEMLVVARTDACEANEALRRAEAFAQAGADAILIEAVKSLSALTEVKRRVKLPLVFNQMAGGKSPPATFTELRAAGVSLVNYSTPCLFAAQTAIDAGMQALLALDGRLPFDAPGLANVTSCNQLLHQNLSGLSLPET
jgi:2-methylisocitrate lyase-like PEP mutase family enzyme